MDPAEEISKYLLTGWHHTTPRGRERIKFIIDCAISKEFAKFHLKQAGIKVEGLDLFGSGEEVLAYINSLKVGDVVIETEMSAMFMKRGVVYISEDSGGTCVRWTMGNGNKMGTSVTWGTRRIIQ
jgi:hypothetical protein